LNCTKESIYETLKATFGYDSFLTLQEEVIYNLLEGRHTLAVMPTGSGKSLCYQLPALLLPNFSIVISPMISLMKDQVMQMQALGIKAEMHHSGMNWQEQEHVRQKIAEGQVKLLYVAPETLLKEHFLSFLSGRQIDLFAIDEAHCISTWGHDFRPEFRQLQQVLDLFPQAVCFALTATATTRVRNDICQILNIPRENAFLDSFNRKNLLLIVEPKQNPYSRLHNFLSSHKSESGLIYCLTRKHVDDLADRLQTDGYSALPYHAGLSDIERTTNQEAFIRDEVRIIVATIAFGMGINKSNIRYVVHYDLPKNLETYYQEIGRSGRDGLPSVCMLLFGTADLVMVNRIIEMKEDIQRIRTEKKQLEALLSYARTNSCRRIPLLNWFGEHYPESNCGMCDNCISDDQEQIDVTVQAQKFLSAVYRSGQTFAAGHIIDILRGSSNKRIKEYRHEQLSVWGIGKDWKKEDWYCLYHQLRKQDCLDELPGFFVIKLNDKSAAILKGEASVQMPKALTTALLEKTESVCDANLFHKLSEKRNELARKQGIPPYIIFSDKTLREMAEFFPQSEASLLRISGVGQHKLAQYGPEFLDILQSHCKEYGLRDSTPGQMKQPDKKSKTIQIGEYIHAGHTLQQAMLEYDCKLETILQHLQKYLEAGFELPPQPFLAISSLSSEEQKKVMEAFANYGLQRLSPIYLHFGEDYSYLELRLIQLFLLASIRK